MRSGKKFTLVFLPTLLVLVAMLVSACGNSTTTSTNMAPKSQQILRYGFDGGNGPGTPTTIDPALDSDVASSQVIQMISTGMVQLDDHLKIQPQLATSWEQNGLTWTFHLKPNQKFSDGTTLDANDVAYSINRALTPSINTLSGGLAATYLGLIKDSAAFTAGGAGAPTTLIGDSINVVDANTLQLVLSQSTGYFLQALTYPTAWVVEKSLIQKWGDSKWTDHLADNGGQGSSGPFKVKSNNPNTGIKFVPNPNYSGKQPALQEIDFNYYKTSETMYKAYQANQLDYAVVPAALVPTEKPKLGAQFHQYPTLVIYYLAMNFLAKPFNNVKIRQAFELAINKDVITSTIENGLGKPTCHIIPNGMPGYDANLTCPVNAPTAGDATKAKQLLQEGMQEEGFTTLPPVKYTFRTNSTTQEKFATTLLQMWHDNLGITVTSNSMDFGPLLHAESQSTCATPDNPSKCLDQGLQMWFAGWSADYPDPQDWTSLQFGKGEGYNEFNYGQNSSRNAATQVSTQNDLATSDNLPAGDARFASYNKSEQQLVNDVAWLSLFQADGEEVIKPYLHGWIDNAQSITPPDDWANIYITTH